MSRIARAIAVCYPHHITQRGNHRATVFFDDEDRRTYLTLLERYSNKHRLKIVAYCLMDNHLHLLAIPETESSLSRGVGLTNQVYTQYLNRKLRQSGRVWQNRFFSCVVEKDPCLWAVARYMERNPVKAGLVTQPEDYPWSSARFHVKAIPSPLLSEVALFDKKTYKDYVRQDDEEMNQAIRQATKTGRPLGSECFVQILELQLGRSLRSQGPGRPPGKKGEYP